MPNKELDVLNETRLIYRLKPVWNDEIITATRNEFKTYMFDSLKEISAWRDREREEFLDAKINPKYDRITMIETERDIAISKRNDERTHLVQGIGFLKFIERWREIRQPSFWMHPDRAGVHWYGHLYDISYYAKAADILDTKLLEWDWDSE